MMSAVTTELLDRPVYGMMQVDRLLGLHAGTARRWIDGYERSGKRYDPIVREVRTGSDVVSWGEFIETRLLANYRTAGVPIIKLRPVVQRLREELGVRFPLAHARTYVQAYGRELVARVQDQEKLDSRLHIVEVLRTGQITLAYESRVFVEAVDWEPVDPSSQSSVLLHSISTAAPDSVGSFEAWSEVSNTEKMIAARLRPVPSSPVTLDPLRAFGSPTVGAVRTDVIAEEVRAGEPLASVAAGFGVTVREAAAAVAYEEAMAA
jgi:hypothetical protein